MDIYRNLKEKYFIVWMAEKLFAQVDSLAEEGQCVSRIAGLLRYVKDQMVYTRCIDWEKSMARPGCGGVP